ncbi:MAG TPA: alpha-hydroxyketone-type quorum-sensing autoinducer synthase [Candidatus Cybelea sp.]|nr:alpha-hydroxyketone-type quorum-sensing autoinducer synthase [Candidatus Cybelea sp.]
MVVSFTMLRCVESVPGRGSVSPSGQTTSLLALKTRGGQELQSLGRRIREWKQDYAEHHITVGKRPGPSAIVMANNDYLSLGRDPRIIAAIVSALHDNSGDVFMSGVYTQYLDIHGEYEAAMADYLGSEATVLCQSGWAANDGLVQTLADTAMPVYVDLFAHASIWQGVHSAGAKARPFRHNDADNLEATVRRYGPGLITVDTVYSTNGDVCPLEEVVDIADRHGCMVVADESHAAGLRGPAGAGLTAELGLTERVHFRTMSLSKAFVGRGGIVAGSSKALEFFRYQSRPAIFSSAVLPYETAGFLATLNAVRDDEWRRDNLRDNANYLRGGLSEAGCHIASNDSPIIALVAGTEARTAELRDRLEARNVFGAVFCAPATPKARSLVRLTVSATMSRAQLDHVIESCAAVRRETGLI